MTLLHVDEVWKRRADRPVLRGATLDVPAQAIVALLGPSGCGKTTLLRLIAGFEEAEQGEITLDGRLLQGAGTFVPAERRRIGYVPQEGTLFPHLTVAGNVGFGLKRSERRGPRVTEALALTGLSGFEARYPHQLSGGQQQRTALARAIVPQPALVLLDEPFAGLDLALRRSVCADVVALLRQNRSTAILVTHDPQEAFISADIVMVMQDGRIAQSAPPQELYRRPVTPEVARLTGAAVMLSGQAQGDTATTPLGPVSLHPGTPDSGPVDIMLRPDQLVCVQPGGGMAMRVSGTAFRGDHTVVTVTCGDASLDLPLRLVSAAPDLIHLRIDGACMAYRAHRDV
ncbi:MAG: ABC transporter ATP-binding protein [Methylobacterium sp.]|nr:MAG: ABC transporter ATP-binding protein [Methylobacterium sp.]